VAVIRPVASLARRYRRGRSENQQEQAAPTQAYEVAESVAAAVQEIGQNVQPKALGATQEPRLDPSPQLAARGYTQNGDSNRGNSSNSANHDGKSIALGQADRYDESRGRMLDSTANDRRHADQPKQEQDQAERDRHGGMEDPAPATLNSPLGRVKQSDDSMDQEGEGVPRYLAPEKGSRERNRATPERQPNPEGAHDAAREYGAVWELKNAGG
jgi:hypothetical protein